jgi:hypothetical protein
MLFQNFKCYAVSSKMGRPTMNGDWVRICEELIMACLKVLSFNDWEMYITWCHLNFLSSPVACFIIYCDTWIVYRGTMQYIPSLVTQVSPSPDLGCWSHRILCMCMFKILSFIKLQFLATLVVTLQLKKHFTLPQSQMSQL